MAELRFSHDWLSAGADGPVFRDTSAQFAIYLDDTCLTRNEDIWSKTVRDTVLVSTYPLALWFASSWWRLNWEPLLKPGPRPSLDWRMAHELGAANHGFVWPAKADRHASAGHCSRYQREVHWRWAMLTYRPKHC